MGKKKDKKNKKGQVEVHPGIAVAANGSAHPFRWIPEKY